MKFKVGSKVEVLRRIKWNSDSWFPGRITSVDGDQYIVKYEMFFTLEGKLVVEKVNHEDVRPQPPIATKEEKWVAGDIAEVFDIHCWRTGKVAKVLKSNLFVVRFSGAIQLKQFHQSCVRVPQSWQKQNHKWVVIGKVIEGDRKFGVHDSPKYSIGLSDPQQGLPEEINPGEKNGQDHSKTLHQVRTLKRHHECHFGDAVMELGNRKRKLTLEVPGHPMRSLPFSKQAEVVNTISYVVHPFSKPTQVSQDSNGCSVASCSSNDLPEYTVQTARKSCKDITASSCDDAESLCPTPSWRENIPSGDTLKASIHDLELHAYRRTLQALYASGPLNWDQESLLTNLRISLHISNEEHLLQLRQLLSAQDI